MKSILRKMQIRDLNSVVHIERAHHYTPWSSRQFLNAIQCDYAWVLCDVNHCIGYVVFRLVLDEVELLNIVVAKKYQGQGFGRQLLAALLKEAHQLKQTKIFLEVRSDNIAAIRLYEGQGFQPVGLRKNYYRTKTGSADAILYQLTLAETHL